MRFLLLCTLLVSLVYFLSCRDDAEVDHSGIGHSRAVANEQASKDNGSPSTDDNAPIREQEETPRGQEPQTETIVAALPRHHEPPVVNTGANYVYGELLQSGVCLRVAYVDQTFPERTPDGLLVIWPAGFDFRVSDDIVRVVDQDGHVVASVGERMRISGRWLSEEAGKSPEWDWSGGSAGDCVGPYWLVGDEVTEVRNERTEGGVASEIFFPRLQHQRGPIGTLDALLEGRLVLRENCLRVVTTWEPGGFVVVWPPGFKVKIVEGEVVITNGGGSVVAQVGDDVALGGGQPGGSRFPDESRCPGGKWYAWTVRSGS